MKHKKPSENAFRVYTLLSQKGGVGKTSLAIAIDGLEAARLSLAEGKKDRAREHLATARDMIEEILR